VRGIIQYEGHLKLSCKGRIWIGLLENTGKVQVEESARIQASKGNTYLMGRMENGLAGAGVTQGIWGCFT
jgi:hypothetical protein